jgi:hypothetical protein
VLSDPRPQAGTPPFLRGVPRPAAAVKYDYVSSQPHHAGPLERIRDLIGEIRHANDRDDFNLARKLNEHLALALAESPEHLLKTRELADCKFNAKNKPRNESLAADSLEEMRARIAALGPTAAWH